jgi:type II secretory pathway pseudopilin PulG
MLASILRFAATPLGGIAGIAAVIMGLVVSFAYQQQSVGVKKQQKRQEKADVQAVNRASEAARRAADPAARGVRDPNARAQ